MKKMTYLLLLDGSSASCSAAQVTWDLAEKNDATVRALYIIDTAAIRKLFSCKTPGFIGSCPYLEALEKTTEAFRSIGETLSVAYRSRSESRNIKTNVVIAEGEPFETVRSYADGCDLLVIGCEKSDLDNNFYKQLFTNSNCPILVVTSECNNLSDIYVLLDNTDPKSLDSLNEFFLSTGLSEEICLDALLNPRQDPRSCITDSEDKAFLFWKKIGERTKLAS